MWIAIISSVIALCGFILWRILRSAAQDVNSDY